MENKMLLCLIVVNCVLFQDVMPEDSLVDYRKIALAALNRIGYLKEPTDYLGWYQAFISLAKELEHTTKDLEHTTKELGHRIENCELNITVCQKDIAKYKNESINFERESLVYKSVLKVRSELLEDMEAYFEMEHVFPHSKEIREQLGGTKNKPARASKYTDLFFENYNELLAKMEPWQDKHTLKWLHYLAYCDTKTADCIREELRKKNINVFKFCQLVGDIFGKVSATIHNSINIQNLTPENVIQGLHLYGITSNATLDTVSLMMTLPKFTTVFTNKKPVTSK